MTQRKMLFNTDIDRGCASIGTSTGSGFRKPSPGSSDDSSCVFVWDSGWE